MVNKSVSETVFGGKKWLYLWRENTELALNFSVTKVNELWCQFCETEGD